MEVVEEVAAESAALAAALHDVQVTVCPDTAWSHGLIADDARGVYVGEFPVQTDDETEMAPPVGTIYLIAGNIADKAEARQTLWHEIGHALGLDETEVAELGL